MKTQRLRYRYSEAFGALPEAYETLHVDAMAGDQTLFVRADEAEAAWSLYAPLLAEPPTPPSSIPPAFGPPPQPASWNGRTRLCFTGSNVIGNSYNKV